jgi:hypothetical protein
MWLVGALTALLTLAFWVCWSRWPRRLARPEGSAAEAAYRRHPAGRGRYASADDRVSPPETPVSEDWASPLGPDDDPDFLSELDRVIRRGREPGGDD